MKKIITIFLAIFFISFASAIEFEARTGNANTNYNYQFNFTNNSDCSGVLLSYSDDILTDSNGNYFFSIDTSSISGIPYYLCEYKDSALRKTHNFSDIIFRSIIVQNITAEIINADNITADYFMGDGSQLTGLAGGGDINAVNTAGKYLTGGAESGIVNLLFNETVLNATIDSRGGGDTWWGLNENYIYNNSNSLDFNETKLNNTIDLRDSDTTYTSNLNFTNDAGYYNSTTGNITTDEWFKGKFNWTTTDEWSSFDGSTFDFNESNLATTYFLANVTNVVTGTGSGNLADIQTYNGITYNVTEIASDFELIVNFTEITEFTTLLVRHKTDTDNGHFATIQIWDYVNSRWEGYGILSEETTSQIQTFGVYDDDDHIQDGVVQIRFYQDESPTPPLTHIHQFDWVSISKGYGTPVGEEIDPLSIHKDGDIQLTGNWNQGAFNFTNTDSWFLGNIIGSKILNSFSWLNSTSAGLLYYGINNPFGFYNSTTLGTSYFNKTDILNFDYYNATNLQTETDSFAYNGTLAYLSDILGWSYYNSTDFSIGDYYTSAQTDTAIENGNTTLYNWVVAQSYTSGGITWANAINGTLYSSSNPYSFWNSTFATFNKTYADTLYRLNSWDNFTGIPVATPSNGDTTHLSTADQIYDWVISLSYTSIADIVSNIGNWSSDKSDYWNASLDLDTVISDDEIAEGKIEFTTVCGAGNHYYLNGNDLACESDDDTTYTAGSNLSLSGTVFSVNTTSLKTYFDIFYSIFGASVDDTEMTAEDFGEFTCTGDEDGCTLDTGVYDDEYIELGDSFAGEVTGVYGSLVVGNDVLDDQYYDSEADLTGLLDDNYEGEGAHFDISTTTNITCFNTACTWYTNATDSCMYWPSSGRDCGA